MKYTSTVVMQECRPSRASKRCINKYIYIYTYSIIYNVFFLPRSNLVLQQVRIVHFLTARCSALMANQIGPHGKSNQAAIHRVDCNRNNTPKEIPHHLIHGLGEA